MLFLFIWFDGNRTFRSDVEYECFCAFLCVSISFGIIQSVIFIGNRNGETEFTIIISFDDMVIGKFVIRRIGLSFRDPDMPRAETASGSASFPYIMMSVGTLSGNPPI
jgi:hypothetical protein